MGPTQVKCPTCHRELDWGNAPFRPFCSERCRLIDLGAWLSEQRVISGEATTLGDEGQTAEVPRKENS